MKLALRTQRRLLSLGTSLLLVAAGGVVWYALQAPMDSNQRVGAAAVVRGVAGSEMTTELGVTTVSGFWQKPLRRPLYDPPPPPPPKKRPPPPLGVELMGTIVEPGNSMAIVTVARGQTEYKRVGDKLGPEESPAELVEILEDAIVVEREGEKTTLRRER